MLVAASNFFSFLTGPQNATRLFIKRRQAQLNSSCSAQDALAASVTTGTMWFHFGMWLDWECFLSNWQTRGPYRKLRRTRYHNNARDTLFIDEKTFQSHFPLAFRWREQLLNSKIYFKQTKCPRWLWPLVYPARVFHKQAASPHFSPLSYSSERITVHALIPWKY